MKWTTILTNEEIDFALHAHECFELYNNKRSLYSKPLLPSALNTDADAEAYIEDELNFYLYAIKKYVPEDTYNRLYTMSDIILDKICRNEEEEYERSLRGDPEPDAEPSEHELFFKSIPEFDVKGMLNAV